jgi:hypothetical protein
MLYYNWILNIDDKKLHENAAEASECIIIYYYSITWCCTIWTPVNINKPVFLCGAWILVTQLITHIKSVKQYILFVVISGYWV